MNLYDKNQVLTFLSECIEKERLRMIEAKEHQEALKKWKRMIEEES